MNLNNMLRVTRAKNGMMFGCLFDGEGDWRRRQAAYVGMG